MSPQPDLDTSIEDRRIYGFGPDYRLPYSCPCCLGTSRLVKQCEPCDGTGLVWDSHSDSAYEGQDGRQTAPGGPSTGNSSLSSCGQRG
ncbi:hypothetical protein GGS23DRAFT_589704 [Durotheca rogersii]|uniref:uncharacterized protein n=1 Tax=Durotheca rogersii TaxID=419775 RepID=UPI00221FA06A|nr:uncharacterized protein GGS23DRAFT_589704 [Durotheca rogersii]KAI5855565.1 hypothetical protein GGS23DRAFT_589704 [Durotheca rogersii]